MLSSITTLKDKLADIIESDIKFLDDLLRLEVLSSKQYDDIRSGDKTVYDRNDALLDLLTSEDQCGKFLNALQRTSQQHVVNFIIHNGGQKQNDVVTYQLNAAHDYKLVCLFDSLMCLYIVAFDRFTALLDFVSVTPTRVARMKRSFALRLSVCLCV